MKLPKTQVVAWANQKGGCGKTSGSVSTAAAFARLGYSVCLIDADPQCNATDHLGVTQDYLRREGLPSLADIHLAKRDAKDIELNFGDRFSDNGGDITLIAGHSGLTAVEARLDAQNQTLVADSESSILDVDELRDENRLRLRNSLESLRGKHDLVFIDTPPQLGFLMTTALIAADWYIIPVFPSAYELKGLEKLSQTVVKIKKRYNPNLLLGGVLLGNFDSTTKLDAQVHEMLIKMFGKSVVFKSVIGRGVRYREVTFQGKTIFEHNPSNSIAEQYVALVKEMLSRRASTAPTRLPKVPNEPPAFGPKSNSSQQVDARVANV